MLRLQVVVLCGRLVAAAFALSLDRCVPWTEEQDGVRFLVLPHPSGVTPANHRTIRTPYITIYQSTNHAGECGCPEVCRTSGMMRRVSSFCSSGPAHIIPSPPGSIVDRRAGIELPWCSARLCVLLASEHVRCCSTNLCGEYTLPAEFAEDNLHESTVQTQHHEAELDEARL